MNTQHAPEMVVTIDGPAGSGKSSAARALAQQLGFDFLDTGAMYRAVAWNCLQESIAWDDLPEVTRIAESISIDLSDQSVSVNGQDVTAAIRTEEVSAGSSQVAVVSSVREALVNKQREWARGKRVVTEGRDQGTIVFPTAPCKFYITASAEVRAKRRYAELTARGEKLAYETLLSTIRQRDSRDEGREYSPLKRATDAEIIDTTDMQAPEVLLYLVTRARRKLML